MGPRVSIVLPVWNGERFLAKAIESLLQQTFDSFELLIIDDGSTDCSRTIGTELARRDTRVVVISREHAGIVGALNAGIAMARGEYVARMDADDISNPGRLQKQIAFLDAHAECVAVGSDLSVIDEEGESLGMVRFPTNHNEIVAAMLDGAAPSLAHPAIVMRRRSVLAAGGYRPNSFPSEDLDLWLRLIEFGQFANLGEPLLTYRRHAEAVGVRERARQSTTTTEIVDAARMRRGLDRLHGRVFAHGHRNNAATYHFDCVRIALTSGQRATAWKHARASIRYAPRWWRPYAALAACVLPLRAFAMLLKAYARLR